MPPPATGSCTRRGRLRGPVDTPKIRSMNELKRSTVAVLVVGLGLFSADLAAAPPKPPKEPAKIKVSVAPAKVAPGSEARVTVVLTPIDGVKINKYPKVRLRVAEQEGLVAAGEVWVGSAKPPPPDQLDKNYFETVDPLVLGLSVADAARTGSHRIEAKLSYAYCVIASGFCAPTTVPVMIPLDVR